MNKYPHCAEKYAELKKKLSEKYPDARVSYTAEKEEFIKNIYLKLDL